jgi:hypothetical protein
MGMGMQGLIAVADIYGRAAQVTELIEPTCYAILEVVQLSLAPNNNSKDSGCVIGGCSSRNPQDDCKLMCR